MDSRLITSGMTEGGINNVGNDSGGINNVGNDRGGLNMLGMTGGPALVPLSCLPGSLCHALTTPHPSPLRKGRGRNRLRMLPCHGFGLGFRHPGLHPFVDGLHEC